VRQARLWNPTTPIIFLSSVVGDYGAGEEWVALSDIPMSANHKKFCENTALHTRFSNDVWRSTAEGVFFLEDWAIWKKVKEFFHVENNNTLYIPLEEMLPTLRAKKGVSTPFQGQRAQNNDDMRVSYSVIYSNSLEAFAHFTYFLTMDHSDKDALISGALYWQDNADSYSCLPTTPPTTRFISETFRDWYTSSAPWVFDGAAYCQYLSREDPRNGPKGVVNNEVDFRTDQFLYGWRKDSSGRRFPLLMDSGGKEWRIANLHIHSNRLENFI
jgi:hypothetical protein